MSIVDVEWWGAGMVICLERGADLHTAQRMPLPLTVSCFCKIQICFTFLVPALLGSHGQRAINWARVCVRVSLSSSSSLLLLLLDLFLNMVVLFGILCSNAIVIKLSLYSIRSPSISKDFLVDFTHVDLTDWI